MKRKVEILAPAGSVESMRAAVAAGADAVYMGGPRFGARAFAENPDEGGFLEAIDYVHLHGCRLYMTVNTLLKDRELESMYEYLLPFYRQGLDAAIVQDMGVFSFIRENFPLLPIHASTQMTITGPDGAALLQRMGASRIVTARELSLEEIRRIYEKTGAEIESFVHGALCYCYSGKCLFSSLIGGRSGNRGRCAQTCRLPFEVRRGAASLNKKDERYVLSLKDLCTLDILPDILDAGVYSLKIEGRMKSPRYTAGVVRIYRKYVDLYLEKGREGYRVDPHDRTELLDLFDRGGQTDGYYRRRNGRDMVVLKEKPAFREENRELYRFLDRTYVEAEQQGAVKGRAFVCEGKPMELSLSFYDRLKGEVTQIKTEGAPVQTARNQPLTEERIRKQLEKTGNSPFCFTELNIEVQGNPFVPLQELNELRRTAFLRLEEEILSSWRRTGENLRAGKPDRTECVSASDRKSARHRLTVSLENPVLLQTVLEFCEVSAVFLDSADFAPSDWGEAVRKCHEAGKKCWLAFPHVFREDTGKYFVQNFQHFKEAGFDGVLLRSWEELELLSEIAPDMPMLADYSLYTMNRKAEDMIRKMAGDRNIRFTLPVELNSRELAERGCAGAELMVYGFLPAMVTAQCMQKTVERCSRRPGLLYLRDRMGKDFPVRNKCRLCYNIIYNSSPLSLLGERKKIDELQPGSLRLSFTVEDENRCRQVLRAFSDVFCHGEDRELSGEFTKGHFRRGVE